VFTVIDSRGDVYFLKFDLKGYGELNTAPEVISMKFVYACGYNTPENYIVNIDPKRLRLGKNVTFKNKYLRDVEVKVEDIQAVLDKAHRNASSLYRAAARKLLPGKPVGWDLLNMQELGKMPATTTYHTIIDGRCEATR